jgi:hypothetical protein
VILDWLKEDVVLGDGGAIFELERRGYVSAGPFTTEVAIEHLVALQLRYLQTLREVSAESNSTTLFPIPIDLFKPFLQLRETMEEA